MNTGAVPHPEPCLCKSSSPAQTTARTDSSRQQPAQPGPKHPTPRKEQFQVRKERSARISNSHLLGATSKPPRKYNLILKNPLLPTLQQRVHRKRHRYKEKRQTISQTQNTHTHHTSHTQVAQHGFRSKYLGWISLLLYTISTPTHTHNTPSRPPRPYHTR